MNFAAHRSLSQQYVFYERLKDDKQNSGLYSTIQNSLNSVSLVVNDIDSYIDDEEDMDDDYVIDLTPSMKNTNLTISLGYKF